MENEITIHQKLRDKANAAFRGKFIENVQNVPTDRN